MTEQKNSYTPKNPFGEEPAHSYFRGYHRIEGRNGEYYLSKELDAAVYAFVEDVFEHGQIFTSGITYKSHIANVDEKLTKENDGKNVYIITQHVAYLT